MVAHVQIVSVCLCVCVCFCMYLCVYLCLYLCVFVCIWDMLTDRCTAHTQHVGHYAANARSGFRQAVRGRDCATPCPTRRRAGD